ncbi:MAG TPA: DUF3883 domain-containing protein [Planctomycetota bacterium]|nr:DUF3883 domain-containing protein [Planctomycetota bacterium]
MSKPTGIRHTNYEVLNLVGYGLAKFEGDLVAALGFKTKSALFNSLIERGVAQTRGTLKNRQDLFNPLVRKTKIGWWQNGDRYLHRKILLDSLFGDLNAVSYAVMLENYLQTYFPIAGEVVKPIVPILKSMFRQLQETGNEAELFFMNNYRTISLFATGALQDARLFGDGYDFQIAVESEYFLAEIKGVRGNTGGIRLTNNEFNKAEEFREKYCLAVVSSLETAPRIKVFFDPLRELEFNRQSIESVQIFYSLPARRW